MLGQVDNLALLLPLVALLAFTTCTGQVRKLICLENKSDVQSSLWTATAEIKSADSLSSLPKGLGDLKFLEAPRPSPPLTGLWYIEGSPSGAAKDIVFKSPLNAYPSTASAVKIYIKYYSNSQRRLSLYPIRMGNGGSLILINTSGSAATASSVPKQWSEVRDDIYPGETPIELTAHLGPKEFILFDKLVLAVDTPFPSDLSINCTAMRALQPSATNSLRLPQPNDPQRTIFSPSSGSSSPTSSPSASPLKSAGTCPAPECKCNCLCNCGNKC